MFKAFKHRTITPLITALGAHVERRRLPAPPVIIGGCGRSGTTLLLSVLDAHPRICSIPEQTYAFMAWRKSSGTGNFVPYRLDRLYRRLLWRSIPPTADRWCEKTPMNVRYFDKILNHYGTGVRLIHLVRDGRDVVTSRHPFKPGEYWVPYERWVNDVGAGLALKDHPQVLTVKYEDMVTDFETVAGSICSFLAIDPVPEIGNWQARTTIRKSRHWHQPVRPVSTAAVGRWQRPEHAERIAGFLAHPGVKELMQQCGYLPSA